MEYLMTYGWAILIIAIVLGALYLLGVFSAPVPTGCIVAAPYYCQNPIMGTGGTLSFTLGQNSGSTEYNIGLGCAATTTANGLPYTGSTTATSDGFYFLGTSGAVSGNTLPANTLTLSSGQQIPVSGVQCWSSSGALESASGIAIGTGFTGKLWVNYTSSSGAPGPSNTWQTAEIGTVSVKAT